MKSSLFLEFCDCNPQYEGKLNSLPEPFRTRLLKKLQTETTQIQFLSRVSESHFIHFFCEKGLKLEYEPKVNGKTPDLRIRTNTHEIYGDIKRFNLSDEDQIKERFFYELATELKSIKRPYYVHIRHTKPYLFELLNPISIRQDFESWLMNDSLRVGDVYNFKDIFTIELTKLNGIKDYILFSYATLENKIHPNKLFSIVNDKVEYYSKYLGNSPFFVCIDLMFDTMLEPDNFRNKFLGYRAFNVDTGFESIDLGCFYTHELYKNVVGILIRYKGEFHWIKNYRSSCRFDLN